MSKFVCLDCGHLFEDPKEWKESRGEHFGFPAYEEWLGCPRCSGAYVEAKLCDCCGEYIDTDEYVEIGDETYCMNCVTIKKLDE